MKKSRKWLLLVMALVLTFSVCLTACDSGSTGGNPTTEPTTNNGGSTQNGGTVSNATVDAIELVSEPNKVDYYIGDTFDITGTVIKVTYSNGETAEVSLPADGFTYTTPDLSSAGNKTITINADNATEGKRVRATFKVAVTVKGISFVFDMNYDGGENQTVNVPNNTTVEKIADPIRAGHTFYNWFVDEDCTIPYDFTQPVTEDITVYAQWKENGATYHEVTYSLNYYGTKTATYTHIVKSGESAKKFPYAPERAEFSFDGWMADAEGAATYDAAAVITADTTIYAGWTKTKTAATEYVFEAEFTDLEGKVGPGYSGEAVGRDMIVTDTTGTASNGACVSYLYKQNISLEFHIASSEDAEATLVIRMAEEFGGIDISDETWQIRIYNEAGSAEYTTVNYGAVTVSGANFTDAITVTVSLKEGYNCIQLITNNNVNPAGEGQGTFAGTAPMVDCIKLNTTAVLTWDEAMGLPIKG